MHRSHARFPLAGLRASQPTKRGYREVLVLIFAVGAFTTAAEADETKTLDESALWQLVHTEELGRNRLLLKLLSRASYMPNGEAASNFANSAAEFRDAIPGSFGEAIWEAGCNFATVRVAGPAHKEAQQTVYNFMVEHLSTAMTLKQRGVTGLLPSDFPDTTESAEAQN